MLMVNLLFVNTKTPAEIIHGGEDKSQGFLDYSTERKRPPFSDDPLAEIYFLYVIRAGGRALYTIIAHINHYCQYILRFLLISAFMVSVFLFIISDFLFMVFGF